jgi:alpha-galactosidase
MVNEHSDLYQAHPDWIIHDSLHTPLQGRHQFTLDLTKKEVQDYVVKSVSDVLNSADISYLKWDYNRPMSDFSNVSGTFFHDYILGLYAVLRRIMTSFPKVLFENCASGGNRFDLGMLSFFAQNWLSDDTDSFQRLSIQSGASLGYPLSVMSNHVAAKTSNQLLRFTSLDSKFDVAAFGVLGYELDLNDLTAVDSRILKSQTEYYKAHRHLLQWGTFTLVEEFGTGNEQIFEVKEGDEAIEGRYEKLQVPTQRTGKLFGEGYEDVSLYIYESRIESISLKKFGHLINFVSPIHLREEGFWVNFLADRKDMQTEQDKGVISGAALTSVGASLGEEWSGTGMNPGTRIQGDFGGRLYYLKKK